jgi:hypothetical protein
MGMSKYQPISIQLNIGARWRHSNLCYKTVVTHRQPESQANTTVRIFFGYNLGVTKEISVTIYLQIVNISWYPFDN